MKKILLLAILAVSSLSLYAQDVLVRKGGDVENVKVLEVTPTEVKFKKANNIEGPTFTEKRSNLISVKYENGEVQKFNDSPVFGSTGDAGPEYSYYDGYGKDKRMTNELSLYIGDGWGIGYQLRREINPYLAVNIFGVSYMSGGFHSPDKAGMVNFRVLGARGYTPSWQWIRGYVDLNMGYTLNYFDAHDMETSHHFGLDFSVGVQLHRKFSIGYQLIYTAPDGGTGHLARISFPF